PGPPRHGAAVVAGRRRRGRGRNHRSAAPEPRRGHLGRAAADLQRELRRLPRAGGARGGGGGQGLERRRVKVAVVGVGLIGGSTGLAARQRLGAHVSGYDPSPAARETAIARDAILEGFDSIEGAFEGADFAFVAGPVSLLPEIVAEVLAAAGPACVVTDVGSVKR